MNYLGQSLSYLSRLASAASGMAITYTIDMSPMSDGKPLEIDEDLHGRHLAGYGRETMDILFETKILIFGLQGLGTKIKKNFILAGVKNWLLWMMMVLCESYVTKFVTSLVHQSLIWRKLLQRETRLLLLLPGIGATPKCPQQLARTTDKSK